MDPLQPHTLEPHTPEKEVGETALIGSVLVFFLGIFGALIGYLISRSSSLYEQKFGSLLIRTHLGSILWGIVIFLVLASVAGGMIYNDRNAFDGVMDECKTVADGTEANNSTVLTINGRTCELSDKGEGMVWDVVSKYIPFIFPLIIFNIYFFYTQVRFVIAAANKKLYRPIICLGGKEYLQ